MVGTHNALVGRLLERWGIDGCWVGSLEISATHGLPDENLLGMREMLDAVRYINLATPLPLIVDVENGYGSVQNAVRAVREFESADVAGTCRIATEERGSAMPRKRADMLGTFQGLGDTRTPLLANPRCIRNIGVDIGCALLGAG